MIFSDFCWLYLPQNIYEMANMQPEETGLKTIINVIQKGSVKHGPRVKVSNIAGTFHPKDNFTLTNEHEPRIIGNCKLKKEHIDKIVDWVKLNRDHIDKVWHHGDTMRPTDVENGFKRLDY